VTKHKIKPIKTVVLTAATKLSASDQNTLPLHIQIISSIKSEHVIYFFILKASWLSCIYMPVSFICKMLMFNLKHTQSQEKSPRNHVPVQDFETILCYINFSTMYFLYLAIVDKLHPNIIFPLITSTSHKSFK
jgi:hypothetical protein